MQSNMDLRAISESRRIDVGVPRDATSGESSGRPTSQACLLSLPINESDHLQGDESAATTLLMYGAYECPNCVEGSRIVRQIQEYFGASLRFAFRHFPRTNVHPHAEAAAEVAEAAGEQNKFWEMHNTLFENHSRLDGDSLISYAVGLRLDMKRFDRAITGRRFIQKVRGDLITGIDSGVTSTPTYFINGVKYLGSGQFETLIEAIGRTMLSDPRV